MIEERGINNLIFTVIGGALLVVAVISVFLHRNELRTVAVTMLTVYSFSAMVLGYTAARHQAVETFDRYGKEIARQMMAGVDAYYGALVDLRVGLALACAALLVLAMTGRRK